jgi:hypothetical protein
MKTNAGTHTIREHPGGIAVLRLFRRRKYIVKRQLQFHLLIMALSYALFFTFSVAALMIVPTVIQMNRLEPVSMEAAHLADGILYLHGHYWPVVIVPLTCIALHSILTSHRIAGPLYRFTHVFNAVERGNIPKPIRLRKGDYLQAEMEDINRMLEYLRTRIGDIQSLQTELCLELSAFNGAAGHLLTDEQRRQLESIETKGRLLKEKLADFKIET